MEGPFPDIRIKFRRLITAYMKGNRKKRGEVMMSTPMDAWPRTR